MYLTLKEARESSLDSVAGSCPTSAAFTRLVNEASQRLLRRGDWAGTVVPIQVCAFGGCIVWPRYVGQVRKMNLCNGPVLMRNPWFEFLQFDNPVFNANGAGFQTPWASYGAQAWTTGGVSTPVFQDVMGDGRLLRFYPEVLADVGKTVTVFGVDNNDQKLVHKLSDGTWQDGWVVTLASTYGVTADYVRRIDRLIFEDHEGTIRAYAYNVADVVLEDIGIYEGHDNNPVFTRYNLRTGSCLTSATNCSCTQTIIALVKLRFIPARNENDLILINNISALKLMTQCIKYEEAGDRTSARSAEADAIREMNLDLTDAFPLDQTPVGNGPFGGSTLGRQRAF